MKNNINAQNIFHNNVTRPKTLKFTFDNNVYTFIQIISIDTIPLI